MEAITERAGTRDPLLIGGYNPLRGLHGQAPERLPQSGADDPDDIRGIYIGCDEAAEILGMGRTQVWRLAKHKKIRRMVSGTQSGDMVTKVAEVEGNRVLLKRKLPKKWNMQPITIGGIGFMPVAFDGRVIELAEAPASLPYIRPQARVFIPHGKIARPVYLLHKEDVLAYHRERQAKKLRLRIADAQEAYRRLLNVYGTGLSRPEVTEIARESVRQSRRPRALV